MTVLDIKPNPNNRNIYKPYYIIISIQGVSGLLVFGFLIYDLISLIISVSIIVFAVVVWIISKRKTFSPLRRSSAWFIVVYFMGLLYLMIFLVNPSFLMFFLQASIFFLISGLYSHYIFLLNKTRIKQATIDNI